MSTAISRVIGKLQSVGGLKQYDIASIAGVSVPVVSRWANDKASPPVGTQILLAHLHYVADRLSDFYTPQETRWWLYSEHALLGRGRAVDLIKKRRMEVVLANIGRMDGASYL